MHNYTVKLCPFFIFPWNTINPCEHPLTILPVFVIHCLRFGSYLSSFVSVSVSVSLFIRFSGFYQSIEYRLSLCHFRRHNWIVLVLIHCYVGTLKINRHVPPQSLEFLELICPATCSPPVCKWDKRKEWKHIAYVDGRWSAAALLARSWSEILSGTRHQAR